MCEKNIIVAGIGDAGEEPEKVPRTGAGEGNRTLVVSLGIWYENGLTMRICGVFNFRKKEFEHKS
jgi:hypothetical protein